MSLGLNELTNFFSSIKDEFRFDFAGIKPRLVSFMVTNFTGQSFLFFPIFQMMILLESNAGLILGFHPANERLHYFVTMSLIGWVQT